jgi:hypothetical protein
MNFINKNSPKPKYNIGNTIYYIYEPYDIEHTIKIETEKIGNIRITPKTVIYSTKWRDIEEKDIIVDLEEAKKVALKLLEEKEKEFEDIIEENIKQIKETK